MGLWDSIRRLGEAGRRVVEKIDALEEEVRNGTPEARARASANQPSERVVAGGVDALRPQDVLPDATADADTDIAPGPPDLDLDEEEDLNDALTRPVPLPVLAATVEFGDLVSEITEALPLSQIAVALEDPDPAPAAPDRSAPALKDEDTLVFDDAPADEDGVRFRNSLGFSDDEVVTLFRVEHYPHLPDVDDGTLYRMSRVEEDILLRSMYVGHAFRDAWRRVVPSAPLWEAAFWFTGVHRDPAALESLIRLETDWTDEAARQLGWAVWPYRAELSGAVAGLEDPAALLLAFEALGEALTARAVLIRRGPRDLAVESDFKPVEQRGVFRFKGFRWLR